LRREIILLLHTHERTHLTLNNIYRPRKLKKRQIVQTLFSKYYYQIYCCEDSNLETELRKQLCVQNDDAKDYVLYLLLYNEWFFWHQKDYYQSYAATQNYPQFQKCDFKGISY